jgi:mRNA-degrading endonuclease RelE of RelBE toxin-antitoxin system
MFELRYKESVIDDLIKIFQGDVESISKFISSLSVLRTDPAPVNSEEVSKGRYKFSLSDCVVLYEVDTEKRIVTVVGVLPGEF